MNDAYFHGLTRLTPTRMWVNNPSPADAEAAVAAGAVACTTNPTYAAKILAAAPETAAPLVARAVRETNDPRLAADRAQQLCVAQILPIMARLRDPARPHRGLVSIQGDPHRDDDSDHIADEAMTYRRLGPNVVSKIPATRAGLVAIEKVLLDGMPVIATEIMSMAQTAAAVAVEKRVVAARGSCPPYFITHITGIYDEYLARQAAAAAPHVAPADIGDAGFLLVRKQARLLRQLGSAAILLGGGARHRRHFTDMVGGDMHVTINWSTAKEIMTADIDVTPRFATPVDPARVQRLRQALHDFRRAWDDDGLRPEEFAAWGPVRYFRDMFVAGWDKLVHAATAVKTDGNAHEITR